MDENVKVKLESISVYRDVYKYKVIAGFYNSERKINGKYIPARAFADITTKENIESDVDAYIIMINPGSCKPTVSDLESDIKKSEYYSKIKLNHKDVYISEAICDMAQKCVMELMRVCEIKKMRILNLSDVMSGNLDEAKVRMGDDKTRLVESIFSSKREADRAVLMPNDAICIISWGTDDKLKSLKIQAMECLSDCHIIYDPVDEKKLSFRYIKPRGKEKQEKVIGALAKQYLAIRPL